MSSASKWLVAWVASCVGAAGVAAAPLRVCADPNNLPFSNRQQQGFENRIASLIGKDMGEPVTYTWFPQREAFFQKTLDRGVCDVVMSVPAGMAGTATTRPYYRSEYVFVTRKDRNLKISSFDDPRLRRLKIGVHVLGDQDDSLPPVHAFISRGIVHNLVGYSIFGNLDEKNPPSDLIRAVADRQVDVAVAWGPMAGYFAKQSNVPLRLTPISGDSLHPDLPFAFEMGIGVRPNDTALRDKLDAELARRQAEIQQILRAYGVPEKNAGEQEAKSTEE
ncbi:MAG: substrate-binding domain-containing protein [Acidobacteriota bacterium]